MGKVLGVLGGMGPAATVAFLARVQALTPAEVDQDHIRILADINPQVPDRQRAPDAAEARLGQMAMRLRDAGAQVLAMPCNTAHALTAGIRKVGLPFIDMIAETAGAAAADGAKKIGVLATPGGEALYTRALQAKGVKIVRLAGAEVVIAGCTEVPLLLEAGDVSAPLVDSAEVLAAACVKACA